MGYTTEFEGAINISPPLNAAEIEYIRTFSGTRRMERKQGPYHAKDDGDTDGVIDYNSPPKGQPGLWCKWTVNDEGTEIQWDGAEKFYDATEWMAYIIEHFLAGTPKAKSAVPQLEGGHVCNGIIHAYGEERGDEWTLAVRGNKVEQTGGIHGEAGGFIDGGSAQPAAGQLPSPEQEAALEAEAQF